MNKRIFLTLGLFFLSLKINSVENLSPKKAKRNRREFLNQKKEKIFQKENMKYYEENEKQNDLIKIILGNSNFDNLKKGKENSGAGYPPIFVKKKFPKNK
jgi:hypothetical protein